MIPLSYEQTASLKQWFLPEQACWMVGLHLLHTRQGTCFVDRWPAPRTVLVDVAGNCALFGDPSALTPGDLQTNLAGFVQASDAFVPLLRSTFPDLQVWERVIYRHQSLISVNAPPDFVVRRLTVNDGVYLQRMSAESGWIGKTWGGLTALAASGYAWGAFDQEQLASVACTFFVGEQYEELGVTTEPQFRGRGLSTACVNGLCADILERGRKPSWSTSPDNLASIRVAEKAGFVKVGAGKIYVINIPIPETPTRAPD